MRGEVHILVHCPIDTLQWGLTHSAMDLIFKSIFAHFSVYVIEKLCLCLCCGCVQGHAAESGSCQVTNWASQTQSLPARTFTPSSAENTNLENTKYNL